MNTYRSENSNDKPLVVAICGPTAGGKSATAMALARLLELEIINCDSMQIYRGLDIGTAKPSSEEREQVPHHLLDICDPADRYSVADYKSDATEAIRQVLEGGRLPLVVGGTHQYLHALIHNLQYDENGGRDAEYIQLEQFYAPYDAAQLHSVLQELDPQAAEAIHPNNRKRVLRAIIRHRLSGGISKAELDARSRQVESPFRWLIFNISRPRTELYQRIEMRVDTMLETGLLDECRYLLDLNLPLDSTCMQAIAYKEFFPYLRGEETLEEGRIRLIYNTRHLAKRQETWIRSLPMCVSLSPADAPASAAEIVKMVENLR